MLAVGSPNVNQYIQNQTNVSFIIQLFLLFIGLVLIKVMIGVGLVFYSAGAHKRDENIFKC